MLKTGACETQLPAMSREFDKIRSIKLVEKFDAIVGGSPRTSLTQVTAAGPRGAREASGAMPPAEMGKQEGLRRSRWI